MLESEVGLVCLPSGGFCAVPVALSRVTTNVEVVYQSDCIVPLSTSSRLVLADMTLYQ